MIALDNSILAKYARPDPDPRVVQALQTYSRDDWAVPSIVAWEFYKHYESSSRIRQVQQRLNQNLDEILPFTDAVAAEAAVLENSLDQQGLSLDVADLLIAATAREADATLVTANANDFDRTPIHQLLKLDVVATE